MKKDILTAIKATVLSKKETQTIVGGYSNGSFLSGTNCSFIMCGGSHNTAGRAYSNCDDFRGRNPNRLYVYRPNPSLYCWL